MILNMAVNLAETQQYDLNSCKLNTTKVDWTGIKVPTGSAGQTETPDCQQHVGSPVAINLNHSCKLSYQKYCIYFTIVHPMGI